MLLSPCVQSESMAGLIKKPFAEALKDLGKQTMSDSESDDGSADLEHTPENDSVDDSDDAVEVINLVTPEPEVAIAAAAGWPEHFAPPELEPKVKSPLPERLEDAEADAAAVQDLRALFEAGGVEGLMEEHRKIMEMVEGEAAPQPYADDTGSEQDILDSVLEDHHEVVQGFMEKEEHFEEGQGSVLAEPEPLPAPAKPQKKVRFSLIPEYSRQFYSKRGNKGLKALKDVTFKIALKSYKDTVKQHDAALKTYIKKRDGVLRRRKATARMSCGSTVPWKVWNDLVEARKWKLEAAQCLVKSAAHKTWTKEQILAWVAKKQQEGKWMY